MLELAACERKLKLRLATGKCYVFAMKCSKGALKPTSNALNWLAAGVKWEAQQ